jgi:nucleoside-diphosphate-sugar epimerase
MRVVVCGATGNVGTSVISALGADPEISEIVAIARRAPERALGQADRVRFVAADIATDDLSATFRGADAVVHLVWLIQPGRDEATTARVNVSGTRRLLQAVVEAKVPALIYASSVGAYAPGPKDRRVDESWPTTGIPSSFYSRHKAQTERELDRLNGEQPQLRIVRLRPGLIFKRAAASEIRRLFVGPLLPPWLLRSQLVPFAPDIPGLRFQAVHADDVGDAYRRAIVSDAAGPFNVAAEPVIGTDELAELLHADRRLPLAPRVVRAGAAAAYRLRLTPTEPGWLDLALQVPLMDTTRIRERLGWTPRHRATDALAELVEGMRESADDRTPPLARETGGPARIREFLTGVGARQ